MGQAVAANGARAWSAQKPAPSDGTHARRYGLANEGGIFWVADGRLLRGGSLTGSDARLAKRRIEKMGCWA